MATELSVLENLANSFITPLPNIIGAIIIIFLGWIIGRIVSLLVQKILRKLKIDAYFKMEKGPRISEIFSTVVKWVIYFAFITAALDVLEVAYLSHYFNRLVSGILGLLEGTIVILVAYILAKYIQNQVKKGSSEYTPLISQVIMMFIMVIAISIAFDLAGIPNDLINMIIIISVASVGLGFAIALGLGLKDTIARIAKKHEKKV